MKPCAVPICFTVMPHIKKGPKTVGESHFSIVSLSVAIFNEKISSSQIGFELFLELHFYFHVSSQLCPIR